MCIGSIIYMSVYDILDPKPVGVSKNVQHLIKDD
jgi:hypothetical protein